MLFPTAIDSALFSSRPTPMIAALDQAPTGEPTICCQTLINAQEEARGTLGRRPAFVAQRSSRA